MVGWKLVYTSQARRDAKKLAHSGLKSEAERLLKILARNPYQNPPPYERLVGDLAGVLSRRITIQHRLVYQVLDDIKTVKVIFCGPITNDPREPRGQQGWPDRWMTVMNETLEKHVRIGTSGWSYPRGEGSWNGIFYPAKPKNELELYSQVFNAVEVNSTFYRLLDPETARAWVAITPKDFEFAIKVWQKFTHPGMFKKSTGAEPEVTQADYDDFKRGIHPIAEECKLACLLIQFSEWFANTPQHQDTLSNLLRQFQDYPMAVELRHASWGEYSKEIRALLATFDAGWVYIDMPQLTDTIKQELEPQRLLYLRFHGRNREKWRQHETAEERYDYLYSEAELKPFAEKVRKIVAVGASKVLIFFNNHVRGQAPANALMMVRQIGLPPTAAVRAEFAKAFPAINDAVKAIAV